jgi:hypothetical protein
VGDGTRKTEMSSPVCCSWRFHKNVIEAFAVKKNRLLISFFGHVIYSAITLGQLYKYIAYINTWFPNALPKKKCPSKIHPYA